MYSYYNIEYVDTKPDFKIMDLTITDKKSQKGSKCIDKQKNQILKYCSVFSNIKFTNQKKTILCNDLQILFFRKNKDTSTKWFLNNVENYLLSKISK